MYVLFNYFYCERKKNSHYKFCVRDLAKCFESFLIEFQKYESVVSLINLL